MEPSLTSTPSRRHAPPLVLIPIVLLLGLAGLSYWLGQAANGGGALTASGTLEAEEVTIAAETGGRIAELAVDEGSAVDAGQVLGRLDDSLLRVQYRQAGPVERQVLEAQLDRLSLRAPLSGVVLKRLARPGEVVGAGSPILTVANLDELRLTLYVLERDLGRVRLGQSVAIRADPYPGRVFRGQVRSIATRAEFTPRNVQTQKDRQNLVFAVKVRLPNRGGELRAGLPVDAVFED